MHERVRRTAAGAAAALSIAAVLAATLTPGPPNVVTPRGFCIVCGATGGQDFFDNILLFLPLGLFLRLAGGRAWKVIAVAVLLTVFVETMQLRVIAGRDGSVGDVVANSLGGTFGLLLADGWRALLLPAPRLARRLAAGGALAWIAVLALTAWALGPSPLPHAARATRFAPIDQRWSVFHGEVRAAALDGRPLAEGPLPADALGEPTGGDFMRLDVVVTNGNRRATLAPIVRIAAPYSRNDPTGDGDQVVALGEQQCDVVYQARLRASDARLSSPSVTAGRVFPCGDATDAARGVREGAITELSGALHGGRGGRGGRVLRVSARWIAYPSDVVRSEARELPLTPSLGWSFFLPWRFEFGIHPYALLSALWLGGLLLPVGYWAGRGWRNGRAALVPILGIPLLVALGLAGVAAASALSTPPATDWAASLAGAIVGWITGARSARVARGRAG